MERFGIFELLDALSSAPARENAPANYLTEEDSAPAAPAAPVGGATGGLAGNRASGGRTGSSVDEAPAAPAGEAAAPAGGAADGSADNRASGGAAKGTGGHPNVDGTAVPSPAPQALESFLRRHDTVSKKVDKKK